MEKNFLDEIQKQACAGGGSGGEPAEEDKKEISASESKY
jgi:hypothetical protein